MNNDILDRIRGCLVGVTIGDALGMPWEMCSHEEILEITEGKGVTGLQDLRGERRTKIFPGMAELELGQTTDDWQLTKAVALSLIRCEHFDIYDQAAAHVAAYKESTVGWGGTTRDSVAELKEWFDSLGERGRRPDIMSSSGRDGRGLGNGVLMKLAPMVCASVIHYRRYNQDDESWCVQLRALRSTVEDLHLMTHAPNQQHFAELYAMILAYVLRDGNTRCINTFLPKKTAYRTQLGEWFGDKSTGVPTAETVRKTCGTSCSASESAAFSISTFLRHPNSFRDAVLEAINAGGDTDTNASIVGALAGALLGIQSIPLEWIEKVPAAYEAVKLADQLYDTFSSKR